MEIHYDLSIVNCIGLLAENAVFVFVIQAEQ